MTTESGTTSSTWRRWVWPTWTDRKRALRWQAWVVIIAVYLLVIAGRVMPQNFTNTSPGYVIAAQSAVMARMFTFHFGLLLTLIGAIAWWRKMRTMALATVPVALFTIGSLAMTYLPHQHSAVEPALRVMSVNLLMINERTNPILAEIHQFDPDVLLLQEYTDLWDKTLTESLGARWPHHEGIAQEDSFGAAIFSKRPFVKRVQMHVKLGTVRVPQIRAVIDVDGQPIAIYNIHTLPPRKLDYTIAHRLQVADLLKHLRDEKLPCLVAGDFNFTEASPQADAMADLSFVDAQDQAGRGRGTTWPVNSFLRYMPIPGIRLDHVYLSPGLAATEIQTGVGEGSDHRPVMAIIGFTGTSR